jgi:inosose dehydratase
LLEQVESPWLKLAFDYSHFVLRSLPLARTIAALIPQSRFIHVKDAKGSADKFEFLLPGEGAIDYAEYGKLLRKEGYRGPIVVEVSGQISARPGYDAKAAARRSYTALAPALRKAELR